MQVTNSDTISMQELFLHKTLVLYSNILLFYKYDFTKMIKANILKNYSQGRDVTSTREVSLTIPTEEIPYVMRAIGFYPSEKEVYIYKQEQKCKSRQGLIDLSKKNRN